MRLLPQSSKVPQRNPHLIGELLLMVVKLIHCHMILLMMVIKDGTQELTYGRPFVQTQSIIGSQTTTPRVVGRVKA